MTRPFDSFVMLAEMRTGSNFLEENINAYDGLTCYGEVFNPHFIGHANQYELLGLGMTDREEDPTRLLRAMAAQTDGLPGFRFFHDHDPRVLDGLLTDPRRAKIILTRNPLDSYVSLKIAGETGQWRLRDMKFARSAKVEFDADEFLAHVDALQAFQLRVLRTLQTTGQSAFYIGYDDINDMDVLNGMAAFLGLDQRRDRTVKATKVQNPAPLESKVTNYAEIEKALARMDRFDLGRTPNFEPRRGPVVPGYMAAPSSPVLYQPVRCGVEDVVADWLGALDGKKRDAVLTGFNQKTLRQWKRQAGRHRSFTVVRHPVPRLYHAFCTYILATGPQAYPEIRELLRTTYKVPIPEKAPDASYPVSDMREAFLGFLGFVKGNLGGQTSVRVDPVWATQDMVIQGLGQFRLPDMILRAEALDAGLGQLTDQLGLAPPPLGEIPDEHPLPLSAIYDASVEAAARAAAQRDYMMFGYEAWA
ncbi:nodulation protein NodH [Anianabacter salinae]|uniref:nodulation protein NodH n=1 Tax=Anianabacter salinae TaxID=2851023 RepID=UPI00225DD43D|nr:nodulation protein NodH [Anianabacter salinae]MBV0913580.1 nodulation protein NodH [Anianabacter salinae]